MGSNDARAEILRALIDGRMPPAQALQALGAFGWDSTEELVVVHYEHVRQVLERYLAAKITAHDVEEWANALEGRDDLSFDPTEVGILLFQLANPALEGQLSLERAREMIADLP